jgi:hypothetical protein
MQLEVSLSSSELTGYYTNATFLIVYKITSTPIAAFIALGFVRGLLS